MGHQILLNIIIAVVWMFLNNNWSPAFDSRLSDRYVADLSVAPLLAKRFLFA